MPTACEQVAKLARDIKGMLRESGKVASWEHTLPDGSTKTFTGKLNQTVAIDGKKVGEVKSSPGEWRRTPKGKAVIYTEVTDNLEPNSRDVEEIIEHERPFICRAVTIFAKDEVACYSPAGAFFKFAKSSLKSMNESERNLKEAVHRQWGDIPHEKWTDAEKALLTAIQSRRNELRKILDGESTEMGRDPYTQEMIVMSRGTPGLASKVLNKCSFTLK